MRHFGQPELINDPEIDTMVKRFDDDTYERRLKPIINSWFANRTKAELEAMAGDSIALTPIKNIDEVVSDPHLKARDMFVPVKVGKTVVEVFCSPIKLSETPNRVDGAATAVGEHNLDVYLRWMGLTTERFDALRKNAVI